VQAVLVSSQEESFDLHCVWAGGKCSRSWVGRHLPMEVWGSSRNPPWAPGDQDLLG